MPARAAGITPAAGVAAGRPMSAGIDLPFSGPSSSPLRCWSMSSWTASISASASCFRFSRQGRPRRHHEHVAPVWDGNETWLVIGGGGLLAAFPLAYLVVLPALSTCQSSSCC